MANFNLLCSFLIAASWPFFILQFLIIESINVGIFEKRVKFYPIPSLLIFGTCNVFAAYLWYSLGINPMGYSRFVFAGLLVGFLGIVIFYRIDKPQMKSDLKYVLSLLVSSQIAFLFIYLMESMLCHTPIFSGRLWP
jgi:hypothetical protein